MKFRILIILCLVVVGLFILMDNRIIGAEEGDRLVGVFITDHQLIMPEAGRIYAASLLPDADERRMLSEYTFSLMDAFENVEGIAYIVFMAKPDWVQASVFRCFISEGLSLNNWHTNRNVYFDWPGNRTEKNATLDADITIYITPSAHTSLRFWFNPVFQDVEGRIYMVGESDSDVGVIMNFPGRSYFGLTAMDMSNLLKARSDWSSISFVHSLTRLILFAEVVNPPEKIIVVQMDAEHNIIMRTEYDPDSVPEIYLPESNTAYLIVEKHTQMPIVLGSLHPDTVYRIIENRGRSRSIGYQIDRDIFSRANRAEEYFSIFLARPDGICIKRTSEIQW